MRYHAAVYLPDEIKALAETAYFSLAGEYDALPHARARAIGRNITLPAHLPVVWELVAVELSPWRIVRKILFRTPLGGTQDVTWVLDVQNGNLVTLWTNSRLDSHRGLDRSLYIQPETPCRS